MTSQDRVRLLLTEIAEKKSIYWIAKQTGKQYVQITRMLATGRCQPDDFETLVRLHRVSRETLQNVTTESLQPEK